MRTAASYRRSPAVPTAVGRRPRIGRGQSRFLTSHGLKIATSPYYVAESRTPSTRSWGPKGLAAAAPRRHHRGPLHRRPADERPGPSGRPTREVDPHHHPGRRPRSGRRPAQARLHLRRHLARDRLRRVRRGRVLPGDRGLGRRHQQGAKPALDALDALDRAFVANYRAGLPLVQVWFIIRTRAVNTRPSRSPHTSSTPASTPRSAPSATHWTARSWNPRSASARRS